MLRLVLDQWQPSFHVRHRLELAEYASEGQLGHLYGGEKPPARRQPFGRRRWPGCEPCSETASRIWFAAISIIKLNCVAAYLLTRIMA
jgi:hypothetical protein